MKLRRILLSTDLSPESGRPAPAVGALARESGAKVVLLHVVEDLVVAPHGAPLAPPVHPPDLERHREDARAALENQRGELGEGVDVEVDVVVASNVGEAIARYASEKDCDLIAISTHGRTGFRRLVMGSVAESVMRHARVPVLSFPRQE